MNKLRKVIFVLSGCGLAALILVLVLTRRSDLPKPSLIVTPTPSPLYDSLLASDGKDLVRAIEHSLKYLQRRDPLVPVMFGEHTISTRDLTVNLQDLKTCFERWGISSKSLTYIHTNYSFYRSSAEKVLITGYYQARLRGSLTRHGPYRYPLYKVPDDLTTFKEPLQVGNMTFTTGVRLKDGTLRPYYTRQEIDYKDALAGKNLEIVWLDDPVERAFLHIQGSGVVVLDTGERVQVGYAGKNGHPFRPIGKALIEQQLLQRKDVTMQSIKQFLRDNPPKIPEILSYDPSYVFFSLRDIGPLGSLNVPVTPFRSIATDSGIFPRGAFAFINFETPPYSENFFRSLPSSEMTSLFVMNQDTGGAIRGTARVDLFVGAGEGEEQISGGMKQSGSLYFIVKNLSQVPVPPYPE
jgi:membrane-bound lytic murein transglycosylase A